MTSDLRRAKNAAENAARARWRDTIIEGGPFISDGQICIPSPAPHDEFKAVLMQRGFRYEPEYNPPLWVRSLSEPLDGRQYTQEQWLDWARQRYAWAWDWWEAPR